MPITVNHLIKDILKTSPHDYVTDQEISTLLGAQFSPAAKSSLILRLVKKGDLIRIKRGLFILGKDYQRKSINLFELSSVIYHPSYVGLHSALSYHGAIPEAVYSTTCITTNRSKEFKTPLGHFSFKHLDQSLFKLGIERMETAKGSFLISNLEKTILDYLYIYKRNWLGLDSLYEDLRLDEEVAESINKENLINIAPCYKSQTIITFTTQLIKHIS